MNDVNVFSIILQIMCLRSHSQIHIIIIKYHIIYIKTVLMIIFIVDGKNLTLENSPTISDCHKIHGFRPRSKLFIIHNIKLLSYSLMETFSESSCNHKTWIIIGLLKGD